MQEQDLSFSAGSTGPLRRPPVPRSRHGRRRRTLGPRFGNDLGHNFLTSSYGAKRSKPKEKGCSVHVSLGSVVVAAGPKAVLSST